MNPVICLSLPLPSILGSQTCTTTLHFWVHAGMQRMLSQQALYLPSHSQPPLTGAFWRYLYCLLELVRYSLTKLTVVAGDFPCVSSAPFQPKTTNEWSWDPFIQQSDFNIFLIPQFTLFPVGVGEGQQLAWSFCSIKKARLGLEEKLKDCQQELWEVISERAEGLAHNWEL